VCGLMRMGVWEPLSICGRRAPEKRDLLIAPTNDTANQVDTQQAFRASESRLPWAMDRNLRGGGGGGGGGTLLTGSPPRPCPQISHLGE